MSYFSAFLPVIAFYMSCYLILRKLENTQLPAKKQEIKRPVFFFEIRPYILIVIEKSWFNVNDLYYSHYNCTNRYFAPVDTY